ncbi:site-specific integrase [Marinobacter alexandrii]|uniref:site-specific integrase n=1 Tax=Marinobacter alexandrii TaxID=2570351 RepID=UPI001108A421|nr:site-specific integrase [Marinobacter alexandrii]
MSIFPELSPEAIQEIGLREDLSGERHLKSAFSQLVPCLEEINGGVFDRGTLENLQWWIGDESATFEEDPFDRSSGAHGLKMDFPVHALLLHIGARKGWPQEYLRLSCHVLWIAKTLQQAVERKNEIVGNHGGLLDNCREVCRRMRMLPADALDQFPAIPGSSERLYELVRHIPYAPSNKGLAKARKVLERCLAYSFKRRRSPHRNLYPGAPGAEELSARQVWESRFNLPDPDDQYVGEECFKIREEVEPSGPSQKSLRDAGAATEEALSPIKLVIGDRPVKTSLGESLSHQPYRSRNAYRHAVKNQQTVPSRWPKLSAYELYVLFRAIADSNAENPVISVALLLSLITGSSLAEVTNVQLYNSSTDVRKKLRASALFLAPSDGIWGRGVVRPNQARSRKSDWFPYFEATRAVLRLRLPYELRLILINRIKEFPSELLPEKSGPLFRQKSKDIIEPAKELLSRLNKRHQTRFTLLRIQQALFDALTVGEGDRAEAALITGQMPTTGQIASLYYHFATKSQISAAYARALSKFPIDMWVGTGGRAYKHGLGLGSQICPKIEPLQLLVKDFQRAIRLTMQPGVGSKAWIDFHNSYTRYVVMMVLFVTGHRAVQDPIPYAEDIDWQRSLVLINDKSGDSEQKDRVVPLVPECQKQLKHYIRHRSVVLNRVRILKQDGAFDNLPLFFFLTTELVPESVGQKTLTEYLQDTYDLPLNINRHLLRSSFRRDGLPGTAVDAFMGHWSDSQNPFSHFSTMDPVTYYEQFRESIGELFSKMGWEALEGLA